MHVSKMPREGDPEANQVDEGVADGELILMTNHADRNFQRLSAEFSGSGQ